LPAPFLRKAEQSLRKVYLNREHTIVYDSGGVRGFMTAAHGHVVSLFVDPTYQRQGIGSLLLSRAKTTYQALELAVFVENTGGILFYHRHGFFVVKRKPIPAAESEVLIMRWTQD
jgi:ribosomal protein S18 acetylase RimI-like enzyme